MDYLRSCYETDMVLSQGGPPVHVRWYFTDPAAPKMRQHSFGSLNWVRPDYPTDHIGEVVGAARPWVDGSYPAWLRPNPTFSRTGLLSWYVTGAPAGFVVSDKITYDGKRWFPPSGAPEGIFPRFIRQLPVPRLTSSVRGVADEATVSTWYSWTWSSQPVPAIGVDWGIPRTDGLYGCKPGLVIGNLRVAGGTEQHLLRCVSWDTVSGVSVWDCPGGPVAGETFTIDGFPAP